MMTTDKDTTSPDDPCSVELQPFRHQVGGTHQVLSIGPDLIGKAFDPREYTFYKTLPMELERFTPKFKAVLDVECQEDSFGAMRWTGRRDEINAISCPDVDSHDMEGIGHVSNDIQKARYRRKQNDITSGHMTGSHKCTVLESITSPYTNPCVFDLKMGTRQHGDHVDAAKQNILKERCAATTSMTLGTRACGMQVFNALSQEYRQYDKYFCRRFSVEEFHNAITTFLDNGIRIRCDVIDGIVAKLTELRSVVSKLDTFRFYSTSLLIIYEGRDLDNCDSYSSTEQYEGSEKGTEILPPDWSSSDPPPDVRLIDFAHSTHRSFPGDKVLHDGPDRGMLFGLDNLIRLFEKQR